MELRHLRYFVAVADTGSFGRAAARLSITQPALWRQVHDLETTLGVRLFERVGRRVRLTLDGEGLLRRSRDLLSAAEQLRAHAETLRGGEAGSLRVGASPQMIQSVLAPFLARFLSSRPDIELQLIEAGGVTLRDSVVRGDVDLALVVLRGGEQLQGRPLFPGRLLAAMSSAHRLRRSATLDVTDLDSEAVLLLREGFGTREIFDAACRIAQVQARIVLESGDPQSLIALAEADRGIAIVPSTVRFTGRKLHVRPIVQAGRSVGTWAWVVWDPRRYLPPYARSCVDELVAHTRRGYPGREFERRAPPLPRPEPDGSLGV